MPSLERHVRRYVPWDQVSGTGAANCALDQTSAEEAGTSKSPFVTIVPGTPILLIERLNARRTPELSCD